MKLTVKPVQSKKDFKRFISFPDSLYKDCPYYAPALRTDETATFDRRKNAAFEFCESECFLAEDGEGKVVGRVAAIINRKANETWGKKEVRYGWIDFIDDRAVSRALVEEVAKWGRERGMEEIAGPLGFTDFDPEGLLVEGFDRLATMACRYHYPYYKEHLEAIGLTKVIDWLEFRIHVPEILPERLTRIAEIVRTKNNLHYRKVTHKAIKEEKLGHKFFNLINETYCVLYGFSKLSDRQIDQYVKTWLQVVDLEMVSFIENEAGELVAAGVTMPSMSKALQKSGGKLFPFGWFHILRSMYFKRDDTMDLLLVAVKPEYQNKGVNSMLFADLFSRVSKLGFKYAESNAELETNTKVQGMWDGFEYEQHKRRRVYGRKL